jgi:mannan endo-1,4-beta-mannosidase
MSQRLMLSKMPLVLIAATGPFLMVACGSGTAPPAASFLSRAAGHLVLNGQAYRFDGLNIFNANSQGQCGDAMGGSDLDTSLGRGGIGSGQEVFRAWFFQPLATIDGRRDWSVFDHTLAVARAHNQRVIFVLANQWGQCKGGEPRSLDWFTGGYRTQIDSGSLVPYREWVAELVSRYASNPAIAFWQLVNEAEARNADGSCSESTAELALRHFADEVGSLIKARDHHHLISLGTVPGECGSMRSDYQKIYASAAIDICDYHDYGGPMSPMPGDPLNGLAVTIARCQALEKPIVVAETGIHALEVGGQAQRAALFRQKFASQFAAGVAGEVLWDWSLNAPGGGDYEIGPGDPALQLLKDY